ncbi:hypothetical protein RA280_28985 [Cupriavidus sp. CV2]|uniref:hypothetical protein n=1 Tax=Cupriavidus ulmosensis TaxID=3065913 RepID=UPI00296AC1C5|nr:hypothetical protein [Cupriavidus sp. CV2]MDW3685700.1 hypothetical protein [Cupriavidus sp. CV2]
MEITIEGMTLLSVVLIWHPAARMTRRLKGAMIAKGIPNGLGVVSDKAQYQREAFVAAALSWQPRDSQQLIGGLVLAIVVSIVKIGRMLSGA